MANALSKAKQTLRFGAEAVQEFNVELTGFINSNGYELLQDFDSNSGDQIIKFKQVKFGDISRCERKLTEAMNNIKNTFDQATVALIGAYDVSLARKTIYFPWADTAEGLEKRLFGKSQKIPSELFDVFRRAEPYGTSNGEITDNHIARGAAQIANDKHSIGFSVIPYVTSFQNAGIRSNAMEFIRIKGPNWNSMKNESILAVGRWEEIEYNANVSFHVFFNESSPLKKIPVDVAIEVFLAKANKVISIFEGEINRIHLTRLP